jgi:hypothetical protein
MWLSLYYFIVGKCWSVGAMQISIRAINMNFLVAKLKQGKRLLKHVVERSLRKWELASSNGMLLM